MKTPRDVKKTPAGYEVNTKFRPNVDRVASITQAARNRDARNYKQHPDQEERTLELAAELLEWQEYPTVMQAFELLLTLHHSDAFAEWVIVGSGRAPCPPECEVFENVSRELGAIKELVNKATLHDLNSWVRKRERQAGPIDSDELRWIINPKKWLVGY